MAQLSFQRRYLHDHFDSSLVPRGSAPGSRRFARAETEPVQRAERDQPIASAHIEQRLTGPEPGPVEDLITPGIQRLTQHPLPEGPVTAVTRVKEPP